MMTLVVFSGEANPKSTFSRSDLYLQKLEYAFRCSDHRKSKRMAVLPIREWLERLGWCQPLVSLTYHFDRLGRCYLPWVKLLMLECWAFNNQRRSFFHFS